MAAAETTDPLGWTHDAADVPGEGVAFEKSAAPATLRRIAEGLDLKSCDRLEARYRIRPIAGGGYRLAGELKADVVQSCVITLEPVPARIEEPFEVEYWPGGDGREADGGGGKEEIPALSAAEIEPLLDGRIDAGRIVFEQLAASLDPYPRTAGAEFEEPAALRQGGKESPFAVLAKLKAGKAPPDT